MLNISAKLWRISRPARRAVGSRAGRTRLRPKLERKIADDIKLRAIDAAVRADGFRILLLLRLVPMPPAINYVYFRRVDLPRRRVAATPRLRRGHSEETSRGDAAAATSTSGRAWRASRGGPQVGYLVLVALLVRALQKGAGPAEVRPAVALLAVLAPFDFVTFSALRGEHYG